jgi:hypothetical protein
LGKSEAFEAHGRRAPGSRGPRHGSRKALERLEPQESIAPVPVVNAAGRETDSVEVPGPEDGHRGDRTAQTGAFRMRTPRKKHSWPRSKPLVRHGADVMRVACIERCNDFDWRERL